MIRSEVITLNIAQEAEAFLRTELAKASSSERRALIDKFILAALSSIPWVGGFLSAAAAFKSRRGPASLQYSAHSMAGRARTETVRSALHTPNRSEQRRALPIWEFF